MNRFIRGYFFIGDSGKINLQGFSCDSGMEKFSEIIIYSNNLPIIRVNQ